MEKIQFNNADKGLQVSHPVIKSIQENILMGFEATIRSLIGTVAVDSIVVLSGCEITVNGQDFDITSGYVFYQNEIFQVDAKSLTAAGGEIAVWATDNTMIQGVFGDGLTYDFREVRKLTLVSGASGGGIADYADSKTVVELLAIPINDVLLDAAPGTLDTLNEIAAALGDDPDFVSTINTLIGTKANKNQAAQVNLTPLINGWTQSVAKPVQYYKDEIGRVHWRGTLLVNASPLANEISDYIIPSTHSIGFDTTGVGITSESFPVQIKNGNGSLIIAAVRVVTRDSDKKSALLLSDYSALDYTAQVEVYLNFSYDNRDY